MSKLLHYLKIQLVKNKNLWRMALRNVDVEAKKPASMLLLKQIKIEMVRTEQRQ